MDKLAAAARSCRNSSILPIILLALETGMRRSEIIDLKWDHFDRDNRLLLIAHTKNGCSRLIPLTKAALHVLDGLPILSDR